MKNKIFKRFASLLLVVVMIFSTTNVAFAKEPTNEDTTSMTESGVTQNASERKNYGRRVICPSNGATSVEFELKSYIGFTQRLTVNATSNSPTGMLILHLYSPNGALRSDDWLMGVNEVATWDIFLPASGTWRLEIAAQGTYDDVKVYVTWPAE